jgi:hypothetical protein
VATLASIKFAAEAPVVTFTDATTPAGHFAAVVKMLGVTTTYLLEGTDGDVDAVIKGRIEAPGFGSVLRIYVGGGVKGGSWQGRFESTEKAFASMV